MLLWPPVSDGSFGQMHLQCVSVAFTPQFVCSDICLSGVQTSQESNGKTRCNGRVNKLLRLWRRNHKKGLGPCFQPFKINSQKLYRNWFSFNIGLLLVWLWTDILQENWYYSVFFLLLLSTMKWPKPTMCYAYRVFLNISLISADSAQCSGDSFQSVPLVHADVKFITS